MKAKLKKAIIGIIILGVACLAYIYILQSRGPLSKALKVSGTIEATEVRLSFRISGKIKELLTDEGRQVKAGDEVASLEIDELAQMKAQAEASLKAAKFNYERARDDAARLENLYQAGSISAQKRDTAKTTCDAAQANVEALQASLELADTRLGFAKLTSSIDGFVIIKSAEAGEVVQSGAPVFTIANLKDIWLTAYINETELGRVKPGQEVEVKTDTYPGKIYRGKVSFISQEAEFTPKQIQTTEERVKLVYRIKVTIDNPALELKPGMPADGYIIE